MLVTLKEILADAKEGKYAVGAFNVPSLEAVLAVISAAEEENVPVILQHAQVHDDYIDLDVIGPIMLDRARNATVPVCVHLDHGVDFDACIQAIRLGFTSVMYDGSGKSFEDNMKETKEIVRIAHAVGVSVEAELGSMLASEIGGGEGRGAVSINDFASVDDCYTNPDQAKQFVDETGVDALAISFGTAHGVYLTKPELDLNRILKIKEKIDIPFVMHGGSGVSDEDFKAAINNGITKVNYYTYMAMAAGLEIREFIKENANKEHVFYHDITMKATAAMKENVRHAMRVFYNK